MERKKNNFGLTLFIVFFDHFQHQNLDIMHAELVILSVQTIIYINYSTLLVRGINLQGCMAFFIRNRLC